MDEHKHLRGGVHFVEKIPRNPQGKILRKHLAGLLDWTGSLGAVYIIWKESIGWNILINKIRIAPHMWILIPPTMYKQEYLYHAPLHHVAYSCHGRFSGLLRSAEHVVRADLAKMWMKVFIRISQAWTMKIYTPKWQKKVTLVLSSTLQNMNCTARIDMKYTAKVSFGYFH